jgi:anti-sigma factor RsiW
MNCTTCSSRLHDYVDGTLSPDEIRAYEAHLASCAEGRNAVGALRQLRAVTDQLPREIAPSRDLWRELQQSISGNAAPRATNAPVIAGPFGGRSRFDVSQESSPRFLQWLAPLGMAAAIALLATFAERQILPRNSTGWSVAALAGTPRVDARDVRDDTRMRLGQWLVTDEAARAKVVVGNIGEVSVEPNSRVRVVGMAATDHRLELAQGTLNAMIWAPPRLFFVNTPSATAVDLGCAYTLKVDDEGNGELEVTLGFVALEDRGRESILRTGMMCLTRRGVGPGTPFSVEAPGDLRESLRRFDFEGSDKDAALRDILAQARPEDSITLWHLLDRTQGTARAAVYDRLAHYSPPPATVTREGILAGNATMRRAWGEHLGIDRF